MAFCAWLLQEKRSAFPRFYFIGDDDLLEILGQATNPSVIQSHLKKLFAGQMPLFCSVLLYVSSVLLHFIVVFFPLPCNSGIFIWTLAAICMCLICVGIHSVLFDEQCEHIVAMCSLEGEVVQLRNVVRISSLVEVKPFVESF